MKKASEIFRSHGIAGVIERFGPLLDKLLAADGKEIDDNGNVVDRTPEPEPALAESALGDSAPYDYRRAREV